jgi:hypothetical protein
LLADPAAQPRIAKEDKKKKHQPLLRLVLL